MAEIILNDHTVVQTEKDGYGAVVAFNGKPAYIIFKAYIRDLSQYNADGTHKTKPEYSIKKAWDGSQIEDKKKIFSTKFNPATLELPETFTAEEK